MRGSIRICYSIFCTHQGVGSRCFLISHWGGELNEEFIGSPRFQSHALDKVKSFTTIYKLHSHSMLQSINHSPKAASP